MTTKEKSQLLLIDLCSRLECDESRREDGGTIVGLQIHVSQG